MVKITPKNIDSLLAAAIKKLKAIDERNKPYGVWIYGRIFFLNNKKDRLELKKLLKNDGVF